MILERSQRKVLVLRMRLRTSIFLELRRRTLTLHQFEPHAGRLCSAPWQIPALAISKSGVTFLLLVFIHAEYGCILHGVFGFIRKRALCMPLSALLRYSLALSLRVLRELLVVVPAVLLQLHRYC